MFRPSTPICSNRSRFESFGRHLITPSQAVRYNEGSGSSTNDKHEVIGGRDRSGDAKDVALLLASMADIATNEAVRMSCAMAVPSSHRKEGHAYSLTSSLAAKNQKVVQKDQGSSPSFVLSPRFSHLCSVFESEYQHEKELEEEEHMTRVRAVSMDLDHVLEASGSYEDYYASIPYRSNNNTIKSNENKRHASFSALVSPPSSPVCKPRNGAVKPRRSTHRHIRYADKSRQGSSSLSLASDSSEENGGLLQRDTGKPLQSPSKLKAHHAKTILRKKFSWKAYPELEEFLIANREEYLRHSAMNYTVQQKTYNNRLTERLLELATELGYVFDESDFSFVTVRDRVRCYFKSYVQSSKKRGVIIGYAARRAGLLTEDEIKKSTTGKIYTPRMPASS